MVQQQGVNPQEELLGNLLTYTVEKYSQFFSYSRPNHLAFTLVTPHFSRCASPCLTEDEDLIDFDEARPTGLHSLKLPAFWVDKPVSWFVLA
jgi:hypothetical protein